MVLSSNHVTNECVREEKLDPHCVKFARIWVLSDFPYN